MVRIVFDFLLALLHFVLDFFNPRITELEARVENLELRPRGSDNDPNQAAILRSLQTKIQDLEGKYNQQVETSRALEVKSHEKDAEITRLRGRFGNTEVETAMAETAVRLYHLEHKDQDHPTSTNGTLLWKIGDFSRKRPDAVNGVQTSIYSPPFYTSQYGYKMCARIYMNGDGFGKNTHISLFFVVMKGEYDALLPWPFQKKITMMLLDQSNGEHMIDAFRSDPESSSFQRPKNNMNVASGSPLFMPLDGLSNRVYVKEETMFIKIIVD